MKTCGETVSLNLPKSILKQTFLTAEEIQAYTEELLVNVMREVKGLEVTTPFPRMTYDDAMARYGSDKPDTRFDMN